ncbi:branched-chain amino acid ABC transporter permease [Thalassospira lucentensis]|uniref:branched-chain amino acid ABC transporter permease n=1 Tax=Thalassospira lucentensis TaxID=168935 RepID=UPI003AA92855
MISNTKHPNLWRAALLLALTFAYVAPLVLGLYSASLIRDAMLIGLMALGLDFLWGKTGMLSFGHATFFGAGAYGAAIISTQLGLEPAMGAWIGLFGGIVLAALIALIIGYFLIFGGVRGSYFTIVTLALAVISQHVILTWSDVTGGDAGLLGIPPLVFPTMEGVRPLAPLAEYWFLVSVVVAITAAVWLICRGRYGTLLRAIEDDERRAQALGFNTSAHLLIVFVGSAAIAGTGGGLYATAVGVVATDSINLVLSTQAIIFVAIGGRGTLVGPVCAAVAVIWLEQKVTSINVQLWPLFMGALFVLTVFLLPEGVLKGAEEVASRIFRQKGEKK